MNLRNVENSGVRNEILELLGIDSRDAKNLLRAGSDFFI